MVIYDGQTGQGCHVILCLMEGNECVCVVRGEVDGICTCVCITGKEINFLGTGVSFRGIYFIFSWEQYQNLT